MQDTVKLDRSPAAYRGLIGGLVLGSASGIKLDTNLVHNRGLTFHFHSLGSRQTDYRTESTSRQDRPLSLFSQTR